MNSKQDNSGFTLIEILVSLSIILVILGLIYGTYAATTQSLPRYKANITLDQEARILLRIMAREIRCSYVCSSDVSQDESAQDRGATEVFREEERPNFLGQKKLSRKALLRFVTTGGIARPEHITGGPSVVAYRFNESNHTLLRSQARLVDTSDIASDKQNWTVAARNVQAVFLKYFDGDFSRLFSQR